MVFGILCELIPQSLESCSSNDGKACSCVIKYVSFRSLDLRGGFSGNDVFVRVALFNGQGLGLRASMNGWTNLWSLDWEKVMHESQDF